MTPQASFLESTEETETVLPVLVPQARQSHPAQSAVAAAAAVSEAGPSEEGLFELEHGAPQAAGDNPADEKRDGTWKKGLDWPVVLWIITVHTGALAAPFYFSWQAVALAAVLAWFTGSIGVCLGYHRHLTHGSFTTYKPVRWFLALVGGLSGEGSALTWVAQHRRHHAFSDKEGDPHSPRDGVWWSHMLWFMPNFGKGYYTDLTARYCPDLKRDPVMTFLHYMFLPSHFILGGLLYGLGYAMGGNYMGISMVTWCMFVRLLYVLHVTWFVNSATHIWGYRNYKTSDDSRNLWWVGLLAFGEGWHNNHHAFQRMAKHGHKWWELDVTYWAIVALEKCGLAWNVVHDVPQRQRALQGEPIHS